MPVSALQFAINAFFFVEYISEDGRKRPKHVGLPHCISLDLIARNMVNLKYVEKLIHSFSVRSSHK